MASYGQFCPVAKTAELVCERWTPLVLRELMLGSERFTDIHRGIPLISPALLSKRLRQLVAAGVVESGRHDGHGCYRLTPAGWELYPLVELMGAWGQRWARSRYEADELDPSVLMWDIRRMLRPHGLAGRRTVIEFRLPDAPARKRRYWLIVDQAVDLCLVDPGLEVELVVIAPLRTLTQIWMGDRTMTDAMGEGTVELLGPARLVRRFPGWLGQHPTLGRIAPAQAVAPATPSTDGVAG